MKKWVNLLHHPAKNSLTFSDFSHVWFRFFLDLEVWKKTSNRPVFCPGLPALYLRDLAGQVALRGGEPPHQLPHTPNILQYN